MAPEHRETTVLRAEKASEKKASWRQGLTEGADEHVVRRGGEDDRVREFRTLEYVEGGDEHDEEGACGAREGEASKRHFGDAAY
jgi:hypothetical protein